MTELNSLERSLWLSEFIWEKTSLADRRNQAENIHFHRKSPQQIINKMTWFDVRIHTQCSCHVTRAGPIRVIQCVCINDITALREFLKSLSFNLKQQCGEHQKTPLLVQSAINSARTCCCSKMVNIMMRKTACV